MIKRKTDMRVNARFADLVGAEGVGDTSAGDLPAVFQAAIDDGWTVDERGAWMLRRFRATYHGSPESFTDLTGYEAAVNGRGIPDLDLTTDSRDRAVALARRGVAFAREALRRLDAEHPDHPPAVAYVSISEVDMDDEVAYAGDVTFVTAHAAEPPYLVDLDAVSTSAMAAISSPAG
jgi:hypothetical protein